MDEGGLLRRRTNLDFIGAGATAADNTTTKNTEVTIAGGGGGVTGSGTANYVTYWSSSGAVTGESDFQYNPTTNSLSVAGNVTTPIVIGSTSASGTLTLRATSDATDGDIIFQSDATTERARILSTGELVVGATAVVSGEFVSIQKNANAPTLLRITNTTSGTAARSGVILQDSAGTTVTFNNFSAGYTTSGLNVADTGVLATSKGAGMNIGTSSNAQLSFWTNNLKRAEFSAAGQFTYYTKGTTTSTSNSVTFTSAHYGLEFLWSPTGTATATLPANGAAAGSWFIVTVLTDQTTTISAATADTLITVNDTTADSVAFSTAGQKIGSHVKFISNGSVWIAINLGSTTMTVAT
jgi:hypothetical protein